MITTLNDLTDEENIVQARHELQRCAGHSDFAYWAKKWGEPALDALTYQNSATALELSEAQEALKAAEQKLDAATSALADANAAFEKLDTALAEIRAAL